MLPGAKRPLTALDFARPADLDNYRSGPGSTLTVVTAHPKEPYQLVLGHIGDSRAYLFRSEGEVLFMKQLTRDHSEGPYIDRALGNWDTDRSQRSLWQMDENGKPTPYDVGIVKVQTGDVILLCTDGIHGVLSDALIRDAVYISERSDALPRAVVNCALNAGSTDNCTVVVGVVES
jgi:protein phosphatase